MKKYILIILVLILLTGCSNKCSECSISNKIIDNYNSVIDDIKSIQNNNDNITGEVNLYLFYLSTCPHCHEEMTWLDSIKDKYPYLHIYKYELLKNEELFAEVTKGLNFYTEYVPVTIIGEQYRVGFSETTKESLLELIEDYHKNGYNDKITDIINKNK